MHKRVLAILSMGHLVTDINQGLIPFLLPLLKEKFGLSYFMIGIIILVANISSSIIQPVFGYISDKVAIRWLIPVGCLTAGAGMAMVGFSPSYPVMLGAIFIGGVGIGAFHPEASKITHYLGGNKKATAMSIFSVGGNFGMGLGPVMGGMLVGFYGLKGLSGVLVISGLMAIILWQVTRQDYTSEKILSVNNSAAQDSSKKVYRYQGRTWVPVILLICVVTVRSWIHVGLTSFLPLYLVNYAHKSHDYASGMLAVFLISGALGTLLGGPLADRWGRRTVIVGSMLITAPVLWLWLNLPGFWSPVLLAIAGATVVATFSITVVFCQELLPNRIGMAAGLMMGFAIGMGGLGATLLGFLADHWGLLNTLYLTVSLPLVGLLLALFLPGQADFKEANLSKCP